MFGSGNFRNEIVWKRTSSHSDGAQGRKQYGRVCDGLLFYTRGAEWTWNLQYTPYDQTYVERAYRHVEPNTGRRYRLDNLTGPGGAAKGNPSYAVLGVTRFWRYSEPRMQRLIEAGRVVQTKPGAVPAYKRYLDEMPGVPLQDLWADVGPIGAAAKERVGYPTQKPIALLDRIIKVSSNAGDVVLDPFAGCATACVSAETLGRQWVGIDLSELAASLVKTRLREAFKLFYEVYHRDDIPKRTDIGKLPSYRTHKHQLFGKQEGRRRGCRVAFQFRNLTVDHVVPQSQGGSAHLDNLQLLCGACNSVKGDRPHAALLATLKDRGILS